MMVNNYRPHTREDVCGQEMAQRHSTSVATPIAVQHQCASRQLVYRASVPGAPKLAQFESEPQCKYPSGPDKRGVVTDQRFKQPPIVGKHQKRNSIQGSTQVPRSTNQKQCQTQVGGGGKEFDPDTGGTLPKGDEYPNAPLACA